MATATPTKTAPILELPTEILLQIISLLCPHCVIESQNLGKCSCDAVPGNYHSPIMRPLSGRYNQWETLRHDLSRLSQTCRVLRQVVQPVLFHCPVPRYGRFLSLARTLVRRPDLARSVREFHLGMWVVMYDEDVTVEDQEMFNALLEGFEMPRHLLREDGTWPRDWLQAGRHSEPHTHELVGAYFFDNRVKVVNALCATIVTNVEHLHLQPLGVPDFPFGAPGSLPRLTDLTLSAADGMRMDCARAIMDAAPALERFKGFKINGVSAPRTPPLRHANLRSVDLESSLLGPQAIKDLMWAFPRLEVFGYESGGLQDVASPDQRQARPREVGEALLLRKDTLRDVDVWRSAGYTDRPRVGADNVMPSLKGMEVLEELALDREAIHDPRLPDYGWDDDDDDDEDAEAPGREKTMIVNFLPPSIRYFKLYDRRGVLFQDVARLAADARTAFPALKKARFWGYSETQRMALKGTFRKAGVKFYHGGYL